MRVIRVDRGTLLRSPQMTPQGFLRVDGYVGRSGVYEYLNEDGSVRREYRPPEEVFKADSLATFEGAPLTDGHPMQPVTATNVKHLEVGHLTGAGRRDGKHIAASMVIKDPKVIDRVKSGGPTQLSPGYALDLEIKSGITPDGERYDAIQRNIEVNHVAIVDEARGGPTVRMRMDSASGFHSVAVEHADSELNAEERNKLEPKEFAGPEGVLPIENEEHVRAAMSRFGQAKLTGAQRKTAFNKIVAKAKKLDIDPAGFVKKWKGRLDAMDTSAAEYDGYTMDDDYDPDDADDSADDPDDDGDDDTGAAGGDDDVDDDAPAGAVGAPAGPKRVGGKKKPKKGKRGDGDLSYLLPQGGAESRGNVQLTSVDDGHQHSIDVTRGWNETSFALKPGDEASHSHVWIRTADGSIEIAENDGHSHTVEAPDDSTGPEFNMRGDNHSGATPMSTKQPKPTATPTAPTMNADEALRTLEAQLINVTKERDAAVEARDTLQLRADSLKGELDIALKSNASLKVEVTRHDSARETAEILKQTTRADAAEAKVIAFEKSMRPRIAARVLLERQAGAVMGDAFRMDDLNDRQIRASVVRHLDKTADVGDHVSEGEIIGLFNALTKQRADTARDYARASDVLATQTHADAQEQHAKGRQDAWRKPLPNSREAEIARGPAGGGAR